ncbi:MAG: PilZ domain-containing protein [Candidatus Acidiferrales bacterium]
METVLTTRNRRSPRVVAVIPLEVHSSGESLEVTTAVINLHGALILSPVFWAEGTTLTIENKKTGLQIRGQIVWAGGKERSGVHKLGVEFEAASQDFWGSQYDPYMEEP